MPKLRLFLGLALLCFSLPVHAAPMHGISIFGKLKYGPDFTHFDYVNPDAPKGGVIKMGELGTFDSLNPFIIKGVAADGLGSTTDTLMVSSSDEPFSKYGLVAKSVEVAPDKKSVTFELRPEARFHDGSEMTADDVVFSFNTLKEKGNPSFKMYYRDITRAEKLGKHTVRFHFSTGDNRELPLIIGELTIISKAWFSTHDFEKSSLEPFLGSGPYKVASLVPGKSIRYERVKDYWAKDLPVNKGENNADVIIHDYYRDETVAVEALKAGEYDFRQENIARVWANAYNTEDVKNGDLVKQEIGHQIPTGMQGWVMNLRKELFSDVRVRKAFELAFDFEWANKALFYSSYTRTQSYFSNSIYASKGLPSADELKLLEPLRGQIPDEVFTTEYKAPVSDGSGFNRENLLKAQSLLKQAGFTVKDGVLLDKKSAPVVVELLLSSPAFERVAGPYSRNLARLGIRAKIRTVDSAQYIKRMEDHDFDLVVHVFGQSNSPGNEQISYWHSSTADERGTPNLIGIKSKAVDVLVEKVVAARSEEELLTATHALDRVLLHSHYVVPNWHLRSFRTIYWNRFSQPAIAPLYSLGFGTWWVDAKKDEELKRHKTLSR